MNVFEVMTRTPATCTRDTPLEEVARLMVDHNCGVIPIVDDDDHPIGVITDRDIVCRTIALGKDPLGVPVADAMTTEVVKVGGPTSIEEAAKLLEENQIRRLIVVDQSNRVVGIVSQGDLARRSQTLGGEVVAAVSQPSVGPSAVH